MRLTPAPLHLLVAVARGARLRHVDGWFSVIKRNGDFERVHGRCVNTLIKNGLVERIDRFDWRLSDAGAAWLAANGIAAKSDKPRN
ncbi:hypothetical protein ACVI1J_001718 [Bradyrhizobium diazoefficiens]|uniref:Uncharacterized protein n=1 Tax=Bradyrhizobium huanghuaihaiense TaxID=990078 RepID=A0A562RQA4_9BRAD|nr:hypothetical protein [Bradyrhizobium huanghuaihaiense]TWI70520.1 hypothetical protein IQ16_03693 [Bradyrhizobium huanghuaihaiense]